MIITIEMPEVSACIISECAYNVANKCHARAITIGDGTYPGCDTFLHSSIHSKDEIRHAGVGACKVRLCKFNYDFECTAQNIEVGIAGGDVICETFTN